MGLEKGQSVVCSQPDGDRVEIERPPKLGQDFPNVFTFGAAGLVQDLQQTKREIMAFVDGALVAGHCHRPSSIVCRHLTFHPVVHHLAILCFLSLVAPTPAMTSHQRLDPQKSVAGFCLLASLHSTRPVLFPSAGEVVGLRQTVARIDVRPGYFSNMGAR